MGCSISQEVEDGPLEVDENSPEAVRRAITTQVRPSTTLHADLLIPRLSSVEQAMRS